MTLGVDEMIGRHTALRTRRYPSLTLAVMGVLAACAAAAPNATAADRQSTQAAPPGSALVSSPLSGQPDARLLDRGQRSDQTRGAATKRPSRRTGRPKTPRAFPYVLGRAKRKGRKFRVRVSPRQGLRLVIPRVARISAPKRTFKSKGVIVVRRVKARTRKGLRSALRPAGFGIDVRFRGTKLRRPLTVAYRVGKRPPGFKPRYTHVTDFGAWELKQGARLRRGKWLVVRTKSFSSIVPSWLKPSAWWDTIGDWARSAGRWASKAIGGRTDSLGHCGPAPPGWFSYSQGTDLVHTCTIDNAGRAEIQIKSNRGVAMVVAVPGNPAYVWVEDRPGWVRNMQARLWSDPDRHVLLGPGQRMTVGYSQPPAGFQGSFSVNLDDPRAWLDNMIRGAVDLVGDAPAAALITYTMTRCFSGAELGASTARLSPGVSLDKAGCMFQALLELANDPERALQIVVGFGGNKGDAADLLRKARSLSVIAKALSVLGPVKNLALRAIDDSMRAIFNDGNARIFVRLMSGQNGGDEPGNPDEQPPAPGGPHTQVPAIHLLLEPANDFSWSQFSAATGHYVDQRTTLPAELSDVPCVLIVTPQLEPSSSELEQLAAYLTSGGRLLAIGEYGGGPFPNADPYSNNPLTGILQALDSEIAIDDSVLAPGARITTQIADSPLNIGVERLAFAGTAEVVFGPPAFEVARTDEGDPFIAAEPRGGGMLVVMADTNVLSDFVQGGYGAGDNAQFARNVCP